jgi:hypothetical protein
VTNIRALLDEATRDVAADPHDATERVRRGLRARRRTNAAVTGVVAVVIAAIVMPLSLTDVTSRSVTPGNHNSKNAPLLQRWTNEDGVVTAGFGAIWALHSCATIGCQTWVDELDPGTGKQLARIKVASPGLQIAAGAHLVWVLGFNPGGGSPAITVINPADVTKTRSIALGPAEEPHGIAFADNSAWIMFPLQHRVVRFGPGNVSILPTSGIALAGLPTAIATTGDGHVWVRVGANKLSEVAPNNKQSVSTGSAVVKTVSWGSRIFSAISPPRTLLALGAGGTVGWLEPSLLNDCLACAQGGGVFARGQVIAVLQTSRGWWVTTTKRSYFYDHQALRSGGQPTASIATTGSSLGEATNGVVIGAGQGGIVHWSPPG